MHPDLVSCHPSWRCRSRWGFPDQSWSWAGCDSHGSWRRYYCCYPWIVRSRSGSRADLWSFWRGLDCLVLSRSWWNRSCRGSNLSRQGKCEKSLFLSTYHFWFHMCSRSFSSTVPGFAGQAHASLQCQACHHNSYESAVDSSTCQSSWRARGFIRQNSSTTLPTFSAYSINY